MLLSVNTILFNITNINNGLDKKILSVKNINFETLGSFEKLFHSDGYQIDNVDAQTDHIQINPDQYVAVIILGGPMAVYDNISYLIKEQELIKNAIKNKVPLLGICLGSQLIAQAIGGRVFKGPKKEIGWSDVILTPSGYKNLFKGIKDKTLRVFQWHRDTYDLPSTVDIIAYSALYPQAFRYGSAIGLQFHLEVNGEMIQKWLLEYSEEINKEHINPKDILYPLRPMRVRICPMPVKLFIQTFAK